MKNEYKELMSHLPWDRSSLILNENDTLENSFKKMIESNQIPKVLTLWQPWATLYVHRIKSIETRPGPTSYRGTYLIHAAKKWTKAQEIICQSEPFRTALGRTLGLRRFSDLPLGAIIGAVDIEDCCTIHVYEFSQEEKYVSYLKFNPDPNWIEIKEPEIGFGNYRLGRYAWIGKNHRVVVNPIPYKNGQGYYQNFKGDVSLLKFR